jgi:hypothetical protein
MTSTRIWVTTANRALAKQFDGMDAAVEFWRRSAGLRPDSLEISGELELIDGLLATRVQLFYKAAR